VLIHNKNYLVPHDYVFSLVSLVILLLPFAECSSRVRECRQREAANCFWDSVLH
jgi:hypothetical protein